VGELCRCSAACICSSNLQALRENEAFRQILPDFIDQDWLTSYQSLEGIEAALNRISKRLSRENKLAEAVADLKQHYPLFQAHFDMFFPDIVRYVGLKLAH
jgi:acyl carrier protein phosphodiesterase